MRSILEVAVAVIEKEGRFLITQRLSTDSFPGVWEFPGGKLDTGESPQECLAREMKEELGIRIRVGEKIKEIVHPYPERTVRLHCFSCRITSGEPRAIECADFRWVSLRELAEFQFPPANKPLIEQLQRPASSVQRSATG